jgi:hypothetical protein
VEYRTSTSLDTVDHEDEKRSWLLKILYLSLCPPSGIWWLTGCPSHPRLSEGTK